MHLAVALACASAIACGDSRTRRAYEYMPDMAYTAAYKHYDGAPIPGTIPRGAVPLHYTKDPADAERAGRELASPLAPTSAVKVEGRRLFEIYCLVCHGPNGEGDGPIVPKIPNPPAYSSERVSAMPAGQLFHVITYGSGRMPSYAAQLSPRERWTVVAYVQTLQHR